MGNPSSTNWTSHLPYPLTKSYKNTSFLTLQLLYEISRIKVLSGAQELPLFTCYCKMFSFKMVLNQRTYNTLSGWIHTSKSFYKHKKRRFFLTLWFYCVNADKNSIKYCHFTSFDVQLYKYYMYSIIWQSIFIL